MEMPMSSSDLDASDETAVVEALRSGVLRAWFLGRGFEEHRTSCSHRNAGREMEGEALGAQGRSVVAHRDA